MSQSASVENFTNNTPDDPNYDFEAAKQKVIDFLGFPPPRKTCGWKLLIAIYTRNDNKLKNPDGSESLILAPDAVVKDDRYKSCTGMVVQTGPLAYKGARYDGQEPWCRVGDWVTIARHDGVQFDYKGKPMMRVDDDKIGNVIDDPDHIKRGDYA